MVIAKLSVQQKQAEKYAKFIQLIAEAKTAKDWQNISYKKIIFGLLN